MHSYVVAQPERAELSGGCVVAGNELHVALGKCSFTFLRRVQPVWVEVKEAWVGGEVVAQDTTKQQLSGRLVDVGQGRVAVLQDGLGHGIGVNGPTTARAVCDDAPGSLHGDLSTAIRLRIVSGADAQLSG